MTQAVGSCFAWFGGARARGAVRTVLGHLLTHALACVEESERGTGVRARIARKLRLARTSCVGSLLLGGGYGHGAFPVGPPVATQRDCNDAVDAGCGCGLGGPATEAEVAALDIACSRGWRWVAAQLCGIFEHLDEVARARLRRVSVGRVICGSAGWGLGDLADAVLLHRCAVLCQDMGFG